MPLATWCDRVLPDAAQDGLVIGINWSGPRLVGWSFIQCCGTSHHGMSSGHCGRRWLAVDNPDFEGSALPLPRSERGDL
jgi:hypothetical protein